MPRLVTAHLNFGIDILNPGTACTVPLNSRADAVLARRGSYAHGLVFGSRNWNAYRHAFEGAAALAKMVDFHLPRPASYIRLLGGLPVCFATGGDIPAWHLQVGTATNRPIP